MLPSLRLKGDQRGASHAGSVEVSHPRATRHIELDPARPGRTAGLDIDLARDPVSAGPEGDLIEGIEVQLTNNADKSRTFAWIGMHANKLYIIEGTVPAGFPADTEHFVIISFRHNKN